MEGAGFENTIKKIFRGSQTAWNKFLIPTKNTLAPVRGMAIGENSRKKQVSAATTIILKSLTGRKILTLTDMQ